VKDDSPEEVLKCNLLVFLQENVMYFLAEDAQRYIKSRVAVLSQRACR
jgi:hypothetical protein